MGVSRSPAELAAKLESFGKVHLSAAQREGVRKGALLVTTAVRRELARAVPSGRLRNVGKRGARVSVGFDAPKSLSNPVALVRMRGPAHLVENPTAPHRIAPRKRGARALRNAAARGERSTNRRALRFPDGEMRASVQHPGIKRGKQPFKRGVDASVPHVLPVIKSEVHAAMVKAFR